MSWRKRPKLKDQNPLRVMPNEARKLALPLVKPPQEELSPTGRYDKNKKYTIYTVYKHKLDGGLKAIAHIHVYDRTKEGLDPKVERVK